ncbi:hypothetical protein [Paenibacillus polymyxa]|nr:hypothetical protein [Paenibacillus polymyxa]
MQSYTVYKVTLSIFWLTVTGFSGIMMLKLIADEVSCNAKFINVS